MKIQETRNYSRFELYRINRDVTNTSDLEKSMAKHGWIDAYPMYVVDDGCASLKIKDGHHRFHVAMKLGIPVKFVICNDDASLVDINIPVNKWTFDNYLSSYTKDGNYNYAFVMMYSQETGIPPRLSASMLSGWMAGSHGNLRKTFPYGKYKISDDTTHATAVKDIVLFMKKLGIEWANKSVFVQAISKVLFVKEFSIDIFKTRVATTPGAIKLQPNVNQMIVEIQDIYNRSSKKNRLDLAFKAEQVAKKRKSSFGHCG